MGRDATKALGNPWYEARKTAAKYDERLLSREGAAEMLRLLYTKADVLCSEMEFSPKTAITQFMSYGVCLNTSE